jgi:O-antigen/teichoic acid export membrane protein
MPSNTTRIVKNTLMLYFRQVLIMMVGLYTVRVVLETLGAEDYGIYNLVGGVVAMLGFISDTMASASQRFFSFELGRKDYEQLQKIFNLNIIIYMLIAIVFLALAETVGIWFLKSKLIIPNNRITTVIIIYQFSVLSFLCTTMVTPYRAAIMAHEKMEIMAYISIVEALLKLTVVFILKFIQIDKLQLYGILLFASSLIVNIIYLVTCYSKFQECKKVSFYWNRTLFKENISYAGWSLIGTAAELVKNQAVNILINQFFNPIIVAARAIAVTVNNVVLKFSLNLSVSIRPQIVKYYANDEKDNLFKLMFLGTKGTYVLMYIFALPLMIEMPIVFMLWIKNPPEYTILFTRLALINALFETLSLPVESTVQATGKIKLYQILVGSVILLNLPIAWVVLMAGLPPYSVMYVSICLTLAAFVLKLLLVKRVIDFSIVQFIREVMFQIITITVISAVPAILICNFMKQNMLRLFTVTVASVFLTGAASYFIIFDKSQRENIKNVLLIRLWKKL